MSFSEWIILRTGEQTWYDYFMPPTMYISVDLAHHEIFHSNVSKCGLKTHKQ